MHALIDADIFQYEFGNATNDEGVPLSWPFVQARVQGRIEGILAATNADSYQLYMTSDDKSNFRFSVATIQPYKGNRSEIEKPRYYDQIRNFLKDHRGAIEVHGMEADDAISITQWEEYERAKERYSSYIEDDPIEEEKLGSFEEAAQWMCETVICSRDKDLKMVPGWHYGWPSGKQKEQPLWWQNEFEGLKCFYKQVLTGDSVDNILGIYGLGKSSKCLQHIDNASDHLGIYKLVYNEYRKRFGSYAEKFIEENGQLLWMLQEKGQTWKPKYSKEEVEEYIKTQKEIEKSAE